MRACCSCAGVLPGLVALVRGGAKEKVVRVGLLATAVLLQGGPPDVAPDLLDLGLHKLVAVRALQVGFSVRAPECNNGKVCSIGTAYTGIWLVIGHASRVCGSHIRAASISSWVACRRCGCVNAVHGTAQHRALVTGAAMQSILT